MYRTKPHSDCDMPAEGMPLRVLILNGSLKHGNELSNTEELALQAVEQMKHWAPIAHTVFRLSDKIIPVGLGYRESNDDDWPEIVKEIKTSDIVLFATPIWWGNHSSLMQRVLERLDALDEEYLESGRSQLYNKIAGIIITGHEDGAMNTMGKLMTALSWFGFTVVPEGAAYWVGEVGESSRDEDRKRRLENKATQEMTKNLARNLVYYAQLLKQHPLILKEK